MKKIGLLSDTHGYIDDRIETHLKDCDEIWHAGDIGDISVSKKIEELTTLRAVYGNIDGRDIRLAWPQHQRFMCEGVDVWITHIGGYPGRYERHVKPEIFQKPPTLFISGHSHILKVIYDDKLNLLHINPGAAGNIGFHKMRTLIRFEIDETNIRNLEVIELGARPVRFDP